MCCLVYLYTLNGCVQKAPAVQQTPPTAAMQIKEEQRINRALRNIRLMKYLVQSGDLVTRTGNDFTSESLRSLNRRDKIYSHCGIAAMENDTLFVYHALGGEFNPDQQIRRDRFEEFADPYSNRGIGLFRFDPGTVNTKAVTDTLINWKQKGITFDMDFDLNTRDKMYCAELVANAFTAGSEQQLIFPHSFIGSFEFIGVDDIFLHPSAEKIFTLVYK